MQRRKFLSLAAAAPIVVSAPFVARAQVKQKVTYAYLLDPVYDSVVWAIRKGKVKSDLIDIEATGANIPTLIQATATKQFDVVMTNRRRLQHTIALVIRTPTRCTLSKRLRMRGMCIPP